MIDTIVLNIPQENYKVLDYEKFTPSAKGLFEYPYTRLTGGFAKCVQNGNKKDLKAGKYFPRLTLIKRMKRKNGKSQGFQVFLKIEFSIPKLVFGNNFSEVEKKYFKKIISILRTILSEMGVALHLKNLKESSVSAVHYSKNIVLSKYTLCSSAIEEVSKGSLGSRIDTNKTDYRNDGSSFKFHTNDFELIFYDKVKDLQQAKTSEKRAIEKENTLQLNIFYSLVENNLQVFRMELRLGTAKKIIQILKKSEIELEKLSFENLFSKEISQKILLYFFSQIQESCFIDKFQIADNPMDTFLELQFANPKRQRGNLLKLFSIIQFLKKEPAEKVREKLGYISKKDRQKWRNILKMIKLLNPAKPYKNPILEEIKEGLEHFISLDLQNFPEVYGMMKERVENRYQYSLL